MNKYQSEKFLKIRKKYILFLREKLGATYRVKYLILNGACL